MGRSGALDNGVEDAVGAVVLQAEEAADRVGIDDEVAGGVRVILARR